MEKNTEIYFDEDFDNKYLEFIEAKNTLSSKYINLFYETLEDILNDEGENLKTWIGETNFRKYIFEINNEKEVYHKKLSQHIKSNNVSEEKSITLNILRVQIDNKIGKLYKNYKVLIGKVENSIEPNRKISKITLNSYFTESVSDDVIFKLQNEFENETGKQMAIVIHFLIKLELIRLDNNDRKRTSRKHFVNCFTGINHENINSIGNYLDSEEGLTRIREDDKQYIRIEKQLNKIVTNC